MAAIEAAGGVLWRGDPAGPEVALVHRPRYDDWSLPKGKLDAGEDPLLAALREIVEETGFVARPARRLGSLRYETAEGRKRVRYWACEVLSGAFEANNEVDELWWGPLSAATERLAPEHDRRVLERFASVAAEARRTRPMVVVRHASAGDKKQWDGPDTERPLDADGVARAKTIAALLSAYGVRSAGTADVVRCAQTLAPYAEAAGVEVQPLPSTTAGTFETDPGRGVAEVAALLAGPEGAAGAAWCGQREVIADLVARLVAAWGGDEALGGRTLPGLSKGALAVLHLDERSRLVALERLPV